MFLFYLASNLMCIAKEKQSKSSRPYVDFNKKKVLE